MVRLIPTWFLKRHGFRQPSATLARAYFAYAAVVGFLFILIYGGAEWFAVGRASKSNFAFGWEEGIPLFGPAIWIYLSLIFAFVLPPFALTKRDIQKLAICNCVAIMVAGAGFVLFPAEARWPRVMGGEWPWLLTTLHRLDQPVNTLPSLHILFATIFIYFISYRVKQARVWLWPWWFLICASVLLVHQHHVLDIIAAWTIAAVVLKFFGPEKSQFA